MFMYDVSGAGAAAATAGSVTVQVRRFHACNVLRTQARVAW